MFFLVVTFLVALLIGVPVFATIGLSTLIPLLMDPSLPATIVPQTFYSGADQYPLIAVLCFLLAGELMQRAGLTDDILDFSNAALGYISGGLGAVVVLACAIFSALSGSGLATTVAVGSLTVGGMIRAGYRPAFAGAIVASGGVLGIMIPPSNPLIIYGAIGGVSIGKVFMAGVVPGILIGASMILVIWAVGKRDGLAAGTEFSLIRLIGTFWRTKWALVLPVIILYGIYAGVTTPTEAADVAVVYALGVGLFIKRNLRPKDVLASILNTVTTTGIMLSMVGFATGFGRLLAMYQFPQEAGLLILSLSKDPEIVLLFIMVFFVFVGTWMDTLAQVIILTPVLLPVVETLGIDPVLFGILTVLGCEIGFLTPPVGGNLFVAVKLSGASIERISLAEIPFIAVLLFWCVIFIYFPGLVLWLPNMM